MGAFLREKKGRYYAIFYDEETKKRKSKALGTDDPVAAKKRLKTLQRSWYGGKWDPFEKPKAPVGKLSDARERFFTYQQNKGNTEKTIECYDCVLRGVLRVVGDMELDTYTEKELDPFLRDETVRPATRDNRLRHLRAFFRWGADQGYIKVDPTQAFNFSKDKQRLPKALRPEGLEAMCEEVDRHMTTEEAAYIPEGKVVWMKPLWRFAFLTGLRISELGRLRWRHIDLDRNRLLILKQKSRKQTVLPLSKPAKEILLNLPVDRNEDVYVWQPFGEADTDRNIRAWRRNTTRQFRHFRQEAGLPDYISFHSLRHGHCTYLAEKGVAPQVIQQSARHASLQTTMVYVHMSQQHLRSQIDEAFNDFE